MDNRPVLERGLDGNTFKDYYYLKEELAAFCRQEDLQATGGKIELTNRVAHYLDTGEKLYTRVNNKKIQNDSVITEDTLIEDNFVCSEKHRSYFKQKIGKGFSFNVAFQEWLKANAGKTYKEAVETYHILLEEKKNGVSSIGKQFEYNTYIRDFFANNKGKTLDEAIKCWKYKKALQGHNRYEQTDLTALHLQ